MAYQTLYMREVRLASGEKANEFKGLRYTPNDDQQFVIRLIGAYGAMLYEEKWEFLLGVNQSTEKTITLFPENVGPPVWEVPSPIRQDELTDAYEKRGDILPATNNVVTFSAYRENGAMMGQFSSFVSPAGKPIGNPGMLSMHGGLIDDADLEAGESYWDGVISAVKRESLEELGIRISRFVHLGDVYDAANGRFNHVFKIKEAYEDLLLETWNNNAKSVAAAILNCEGLGRASMLFRENLERAMEIGDITPISVAILKAFPQLMPPPAPATDQG